MDLPCFQFSPFPTRLQLTSLNTSLGVSQGRIFQTAQQDPLVSCETNLVGCRHNFPLNEMELNRTEAIVTHAHSQGKDYRVKLGFVLFFPLAGVCNVPI